MLSSILSLMYLNRFDGEGVESIGGELFKTMLLEVDSDCKSFASGVTLRLRRDVGVVEIGCFLPETSKSHLATKSLADKIRLNFEDIDVLFHSCVFKGNIILPFSQQNYTKKTHTEFHACQSSHQTEKCFSLP